jgi:uncharacterized protein (DUF885 family)
MKTKILFLFLSLFAAACSNVIPVELADENSKLSAIIAQYQTYKDNSNPFNKAEPGGNNAKLPDLSPKALLVHHQALDKIYTQLQRINNEALSPDNKINLSVLSYRLKNELDGYINKAHYIPLMAESGFHVWISNINKQVNFKTQQDYQDYLSRLKALPQYFSQQTAWMKQGIEEGITQPQVVLQGFEKSINAFIKDDVTKSLYYQPFLKMSNQLDDDQKQTLQQEAQKIIAQQVIPTYQDFYQFMVEEYQPKARKNIAANSLPHGDAFYQNRVKHYTTLPVSAEEIHQIGLSEVKRIRSEMDNIIKKVNFDGDFAAFVDFLRTDKQFYATTPEGLLKEASYIAKKMDAKLPGLFKILPRTPYGVIPVPANIAPKYTTGRYSGPSRDDQPGNYWVNTYRLDRRPLYVLEALTLHEAVPGHHLQGSIAREMTNVPEFRRRTYISAFGEGWGLYAEFLGVEAGFYQDPYSDFGRLTYEMWRACRLVVDTGIHVKGWSRQKSIDYLAGNTALSLHNVTTEIDRYISWPGQALSYKMGELTIKRLRGDAEKALGDNFDLREFHDEILKNGSMPLSMLESVINEYVNTKKNIDKKKV